MLDLAIDPKLAWALKHRERFPVDLARAPREALLRVPLAIQRESHEAAAAAATAAAAAAAADPAAAAVVAAAAAAQTAAAAQQKGEEIVYFALLVCASSLLGSRPLLHSSPSRPNHCFPLLL
jgi:hypothetical protein